MTTQQSAGPGRPAWKLLWCLPALALAACAGINDIPPDAPVSEAMAVMGKPRLSCPLPDGGQRLVWSTQPTGQYAWRADTDASGRIVGRVIPVLTDEEFRTVQSGRWTRQDVRCAFGPPAESSEVGLPSVRQVVWSYRYRQNGVWNSLMHIYFSNDGEYVTRMHPGPDPMFDPDDNFFRMP